MTFKGSRDKKNHEWNDVVDVFRISIDYGYSNPLVWEVRTAKLIVAQSSLQDNQVVAARKVAKHSESSLNDLHSGLKDYEIDCGHIRSFI